MVFEISRYFDSDTMSSIGEGKNITFWQRLKRQKTGLGNMALAASTLVLALRLIDQDKELERMKTGESSLLEALRRENHNLQERFVRFQTAVEEEIGRAGNRMPPLSTRIQTLIEKSNSEEPRPLVSREVQRGQEPETLQPPAKGKSNFMV